MVKLSASATAVLDYARKQATYDGYVDMQDYTDLSEDVVRAACNELQRRGLISDVTYSDDGVEYFQLNA